MNRKHSFFRHISTVLLVTALTALVLGGCGSQKQNEPQTVPETTVEAPTQTTEPAAEQNVKPVERTPGEMALLAYQELLKSNPALEGTHDELNDLTFGYEENLAKFGNHYDYFAIRDLNHDGIPELFAVTVINNRWTPVSVFTYDAGVSGQGQIVLLKDPMEPSSHATFEQMSTAGGAYTLYICPDNHIHNVWGGDTPIGYQEENNAYILNGTELVLTACSLGANEDTGSRETIFDYENTESGRNAISEMISG